MLTGLIDKLKATKEADGSSLFDHTALAFGSNISSIHYLDNCPTILTGGGANLKLGHLALPKDTPLCNVWLTMLQGLGIQTSHGDREWELLAEKLSLSTVTAFLGLLAFRAADLVVELPAKHFDLIESYCLDCHDGETQKGKVNLEALSFKDTLEQAGLWQKVLDVRIG